MFLSKKIIGCAEVTLDVKNRFIVPNFTDVDFGDELILYRDINYFSIYEKNYWIEMSGIKNITDLYVQKDLVDYKFFDVIGSVVVDRQKRILLPKYVVDYYNLNCYYNNSEREASCIFVKGAWDHINVFKDDIKSKKLIKG